MDLSGSMLADDAGGTRLDAAKRASTELIDSLPDDALLGMLVYGQLESSDESNRERGCQDIEVLSPVQKVDKEGLKSKIAGLEAQGYTPIGNALRKAADELGPDGERSIILVSDGIDTCAPPPVCEVAKELAGQGVGLTIHTVGFKVDEEARAELECVAQVSGGQSMTADDATQLADHMKFLTQRSVQGYETTGTPFEFSETKEGAKWLGEGKYQTTLVPEVAQHDRTPLYYRIAVPKGHNAIVTSKVLANIDAEGKGQQEVRTEIEEIINETGGECQDDSRMGSLTGATATADSWTPNSADASILEWDSDSIEPSCDQTKWLVENNVWVYDSESVADYRDEPVKVEVSVQFEPVLKKQEADKLDEGRYSSGDKAYKKATFGEAKPVSGGNNAAQAPEVKSGDTISDTIVPGEQKFYKIPVEWGQRPVIAARTGNSERDNADSMGVALLNPFEVSVADGTMHFYQDSEDLNLSTDRPVEYNNRSTNVGGQSIANAGYYYATVRMANYRPDEEVTGIDQPFQLAFLLDNKPTKGPDWRPTDKNGPTPSDKPILAKGESEKDSSKESSEDASKESDSPDTDSQASASSSDIEDEGMSPLVIGTVVAVVAVFIGIVGAIVYQNKKRQE
ncbi:VWA domain-containing protein [Corynebacterium amycolatum]|uniref:vWA domain-containing protein n=1 Tax=Corynebacterium amycolatum TaxID=43765 RepID=UPI002119D394|nr:VWA domain-containing protein [Corynebacterium amycolatum]MCQ9126041.1 VWA domain-containing protein [Corynebacterium amycolatum]MCQ9169245.1 VWA domain-containing protein [Corynebacterium amycolatum]